MKRIALALCATLTATAAMGGPYVSNQIKYRDSGHQPATGRSGGAEIRVLALIDKAGVADVEVSAAAPGSLEHVQVKTDRQTSNYQASGASLVTPLQDVGPGSAVSVLANVVGTDGARTGVVAVSDSVMRRPDLTPTQILAPDTADAGMPVQISATVRELNGDVGARATCVLRVDGETVDRATNIWVDAEGLVSCSFVHAFGTVGESQVEIALEDVSPRDYDDANNRASRKVRVNGERRIDPTGWFIFAGEQESWSESHGWSVWGHDFRYRGTLWQQDVQLGVVMQDTRLNMETMKLRYSEKSDGRTVLEFDPVPLTLTPVYAYRQCGWMYADDWSLEILVCQRFQNDDWWYEFPYDQASVSVRREAADVTYYGRESAPAMDGYPAYDREFYVANKYGTQVRYGNTVSFDVHLTDGSQTMHLQRTIPLQLTEYPYSEHTMCWGDWCQSSKGEGWSKSGMDYQ